MSVSVTHLEKCDRVTEYASSAFGSIGIFRTQSNIYDKAFLAAKSR